MQQRHLFLIVLAVLVVAIVLHATRLGDDDMIEDRVTSVLEDHPAVDASRLDVSVEDGVVTLTGPLPHKEARRAAVSEVEKVDGVERIIDRTTVETEGAPDQPRSPPVSKPRPE